MWRLIKVYPGSEGKKIHKILENMSDYIGENIDILVYEYIIPSIDLNAKSLSGIIFININPTYKDKIFKFFYLSEDIFHQESLQSIDDNEMHKLKSKQKDMFQNPINKFQPGKIIDIIQGDYAGLHGKVVKIKGELIDISISVFGEDQIITVPYIDIKLSEV